MRCREGQRAVLEVRVPPEFYVPDLASVAKKQSEERHILHNQQFAVLVPLLRQQRLGEWSGVMVAYGKGSGDAWFAGTTIEQAAILGCDRFLVPGSHTGYRYELEAFTLELLRIFEAMEEEERIRSPVFWSDRR
jgi:hypothetical protein